MHTKLAIIDDRWLFVSSPNFDPPSDPPECGIRHSYRQPGAGSQHPRTSRGNCEGLRLHAIAGRPRQDAPDHRSPVAQPSW
ncbi:hypothetical protein [Phaeobacter gallaeciensis]|uniref:hypothetical protein n=1 Tax=Phaeobacter gallaeciensis TaxID=60890 RepID=UPI003CD024E7